MPSAPPRLSPCLAAALEYLERGWSALALCPPDHQGVSGQHEKACRRPGKVPLGPWKDYTERLPRPAELRLLWNRCPTANVGVALGPVSGLVALDIDGSAGEKLLRTLLQTYGEPLPATLEFVTGGGRRLLFSHPADIVLNDEIAAADGEVRLLAKGRQTVMPPSIHQSGRTYEWTPGGRPGEIDLAELPAWLPELLRDPAGCGVPGDPAPATAPPADESPAGSLLSPLDRARKYLDACEPCDPRPEHPMDASTHLLKAATALVVGFALDIDDAVALLAVWDQRNPVRPYSERELRRKCQEALRASPKQKGYLMQDRPPSPSRNGHSKRGSSGPRLEAEDLGEAPRPQPQAKPTPPLEIYGADDLMRLDLPAMKWAVDGLIPEGATILAGRPKIGKSWLVLNTALAIALGGVVLGRTPVQPGRVLYLALEDGKRRLQRRIAKLLPVQCLAEPPPLLRLSTNWPRSSEGGIDALNTWIDQNPDCRLIVIDTMARIRDKRRSDVGLYDEDYAAIAMLQALGLQRGIAVLIVHHTRKAVAEDPLDDVSGTIGLTGAADVVLVLKRQRHGTDGKLFITGRDVDERELDLRFDTEYCLWTQTEGPGTDDPEAHLSKDQKVVRQLLRDQGAPMSLLDINAKLRREYSATAKLVQRMAHDGLLKKAGYGLYELPSDSHNSPIPE